MAIKSKRRARKARRAAHKITFARAFGRLDAAILVYGWADPADDGAFFSAEGHGGMSINDRVNEAYWRGFRENTAQLMGEVYIHQFS